MSVGVAKLWAKWFTSVSVMYILLAFFGEDLNSIGAPTDTTLDTLLSAFFEILLRFQALRNFPLPTGRGTQTVSLLGR